MKISVIISGKFCSACTHLACSYYDNDIPFTPTGQFLNMR